jgi:glycosyltransferase involved in cell wall biosynthesis
MTDSDTVGYIIPVYNEADILEEQLRLFSEFLDTLDDPYQIIVVENGSRDDTLEILEEMAAEYSHITAHSLDNADYGDALKAGMKRTPCERNFLLNIDWLDKTFVRRGLEELENHDLVIGSKRLGQSVDNRSPYRKLLSWGLNTLLRILVGFRGTETHGLKAFRRSTVGEIVERCEMNRGMFDTEVVIRAQKEGLRTTELPVELTEDRPPRNWMIKKIGQNLVDIWGLTYVIRRDYGFR